jgi:hypothetical protein
MPRSNPPGPGSGEIYPVLTSEHPIRGVCPLLADEFEAAVREYVLPRTRQAYASAVRSLTSFSRAYECADVFPLDPITVACWILYAAEDIKISSIKCYLCAFKYEQICRGLPWTIDGNPYVHRALIFATRKFGAAGTSAKFPITMDILRVMFARVPGWPNLSTMSHDHRVFVTASVVAVLGFLRGGEFLVSSGSHRPMLLGGDLKVRCFAGAPALEVVVQQPKARWWLKTSPVTCFSPSPSSLFDPVWLVQSMRQLSPVPMGENDAAFRMSCGRPLSKSWMLKTTRHFLRLANVDFPQHLGKVDVRAASWRSGGACSAKRAGVSDATIMLMGRWASLAWLRYVRSTTLREVQAAYAKMEDANDPNQDELALVGQDAFAVPIEDALPEELHRLHTHRRAGVGTPQLAAPSPHRRTG